MASYTVTAVDPSLAILGVPTEVRNVSGAAAALKAVQELADKGKENIQIIQHDGGKVSISDLQSLIGKE